MELINRKFESKELCSCTSLGIGGYTENYIEVNDILELVNVVSHAIDNSVELIVLGEGSNVLISDNGFDGIVVKNRILGIEAAFEDEKSIILQVGAGENWDNFVQHTVSLGLWGAENLSLIPGTVGATPIQNVGAFGQEVKNIIHSIRAFDTKTQSERVFAPEECEFGFRSSIFNGRESRRYIITYVSFKLSKEFAPILSRSEVKNGIIGLDIDNITPSLIRNIVIKHRTSGLALPNSESLGSAGTFFRTAIVDSQAVYKIFFKTLFNLGPKVALMILAFGWKYRSKEGFRLPSKILIDACNLKGLRVGSSFLYGTNSAVVTTSLLENPSSSDIINILQIVRKTVYYKTGVKIPIEPTLLGFSDKEIYDIFDIG
ncbi:TPA: UDP-N-acetylmuramate dehydrogenase [Vibrio vulnificus]|nr:UDP-N-acetylmuramate dehydrogenase [Vibrio vulnificus]